MEEVELTENQARYLLAAYLASPGGLDFNWRAIGRMLGLNETECDEVSWSLARLLLLNRVQNVARLSPEGRQRAEQLQAQSKSKRKR